MASPQLNKGYTRVANEILDHITQVNLNGTQFRIVISIWRLTYGFKRKEHDISVTHLAKLIDASRTQVNRELVALMDRNIIVSTEFGSRGARKLKFNKNYDEWKSPSKKQCKSNDKPKNAKKTVKTTVKKRTYDEDNTYYKMALYFHQLVSKVAKDAGVEHLIAKANLQTWSDDFRKLIEINGVDKRLAKDVMDWVTQDSFWKTNVLSAKKLREKFTDLAIKMNESKHKQNVNHIVPKKDTRDKEIEFQRFIANGGDPDEFNWSS